MSFDKEKLPVIAVGTEKTIYEHPHNSEKVVAITHEGFHSGQEARARFYLTKTLHILFPKNIPDISSSRVTSDEKIQMVLPKKHLDLEHEALRDDMTSYQSRRGDINWNGRADIEHREIELEEQLKKDSQFINFKKKADDLGIGFLFDMAARNFGYDNEGNLVYIDNSFEPWEIGPDGRIEFYDYEKLKKGIEALKGVEKEQALGYLDRIEEIQKEAASELKSP